MFKLNSDFANLNAPALLIAVCAVLPVGSIYAQGLDDYLSLQVISSEPMNPGELEASSPLFKIERRASGNDFNGVNPEKSVDMSLSLEITPLKGLNLHADAWKLSVQDPAVNSGLNGGWESPLNNLVSENSADVEFSMGQPFTSNNIESSGVDLGASYVWSTENIGQFTLSSTATYVNDFSQANNLPEIVSLTGPDSGLSDIPDLQSSLTLTWQFGNHTASAITNYFDSFKDLDDLNIDEINKLVDNITTFDLQYGYQVKTGSQDKAIISFGVRNIFDKKTTQILNQNSRVIDQNGRVAYGSIKYQF